MSEHACPYKGKILFPAPQCNPGEWSQGGEVPCGAAGYLCDMCREDRADTRTEWLVEALALVSGVLPRKPGAVAALLAERGKENTNV